MLEYIKGNIAELNPASVIIDNNGIGYEIGISLSTYSQLEGRTEAKLLLHEVIREDAHLLFGFATTRERELFRLLIGVSGVGANTARVILSSIAPAELETVIATADEHQLKAVKGVGAKTAQRIIVDLRDKIKPVESSLIIERTATTDAFNEGLAALTMLGFPRQASEKVLKKLFADDPSLRVESAIKQALKML
ncbi:MAG: Holliday junction branch migration protein RuvA [bacterium]|nr:Holliday junction branch migration protein RuvA [bacterium]